MTDSLGMSQAEQDAPAVIAERMSGIESRLQTLRDRILSDRGRPLDALSVGALGHELTNLLTPAIVRGQRMLLDPDLEPRARRELEAIVAATKRATELGDLMLAATADGEPSGCDLKSIADEVAGLVATDRLEITRTVSEGVRAAAPELAVRHTVLNLVANASRAMGDRGRIEIRGGCSTGNTSDGVWLEVVDTGPGVPPSEADRLFERGVGRSGRGLGLAIGQRLIERHGGTLRLDRSSASGSVFRLELPAA